MMPPTLLVLRPGPLSTFQDLGRPGYAAVGVGRSGAADRGALRLANTLVGNSEGTVGVEMTFGGLRLQLLPAADSVRTADTALVAVTGAWLPIRVIGVDGVKTDRPVGVSFRLAAGEQLDLGRPTSGLRSYLAVAGGFEVSQTLGSGSTDTLSGLGPAPLAAGTKVLIGQVIPQFDDAVTSQQSVLGEPTVSEPVGSEPVVSEPVGTRGSRHPATVLRIRLGPRDNFFSPAGLETLFAQEWTVTPSSNRVGMKLSGNAIARSHHQELPSEGLLPGAIQIPPNGMPVIFLADHPVTGGYPVVGVVLRMDQDLAAQLRPGERVRFILANG